MGVGLIGRVDPNEGVWLQIDPSRTQRIELAKELSDIYCLLYTSHIGVVDTGEGLVVRVFQQRGRTDGKEMCIRDRE